MKLIDKYVYAATKNLPEDTREDVIRELHANIEDMLPENPTEDNVRQVLLELGNPKKLANEYSQTKRYLIGPSLYDNYISVLKLVTGIVAIVFACIALLDGIFAPTASGSLFEISIETFVNIIVAVIEGIVQGAVWVTIIFAVLERSGAKKGKEWSPDDLPEVPVSSKNKISRGETVFSMFWTVLFTALVYFKPQLIAVYIGGENGVTQTIPLIDIGGLRPYEYIIVILAIIQLGIFIWKFIAKHWNLPLALANTALNVALCILLVVMVIDNSLLNIDFIPTIADHTRTSITKVTSIWSSGIRSFTIVFIAICIWDSVAVFLKLKK